ncbi:MAG: PAS domain S-box protein [Desulfamplus sp.]|nr:PAS domain S-box protein [Desulfamplus sp.]
MNLDIKTIMIMNLIINVVATISIAIIWYYNKKRFAGVDLWVWCMFFQVAGVLLILLKGAIHDSLSILLSNVLLICSALILLVGLENFTNCKGKHTHNYIVIVLFILLRYYFTFIEPNLGFREIIMSGTIIIIHSQIFWLMFKRVPSSIRHMTLLTGIVSGGFVLASIFKLAMISGFDLQSNEFFKSGAINALTITMYITLNFCITISLILMINKRLLKDAEVQNEKFKKIFHSAPYAIAITELYEGKFLEANDSYVNMSGYQRSELIGKTGVELNMLTKEVREAVVSKLLKGEKIEKMEGEMRRKSGEVLMIIGSVQLIDIHGQLCMIGSHADITELKMAHQSRLNAMSDLISTIAHQWRQPLATLGMMIQRTHAVAHIKGITNEYIDAFKESAMSQIKYMSDTIDIFRGFYRPQKEKAPFSPLSCINDCVRLLEHQFANSKIQVYISSPSDYENQLINGFSSEFKQVILNLLGNARDAIEENFKSTNRVEEGVINIVIDVSFNGTMVIEIGDNGSGINDEIAQKIFAPYFTTKESSGGTGIGLYMSRMIIRDSLKGDITLIKSDKNKGATFRIELPIAIEPQIEEFKPMEQQI